MGHYTNFLILGFLLHGMCQVPEYRRLSSGFDCRPSSRPACADLGKDTTARPIVAESSDERLVRLTVE
jgi:hypothetical protein